MKVVGQMDENQDIIVVKKNRNNNKKNKSEIQSNESQGFSLFDCARMINKENKLDDNVQECLSNFKDRLRSN